MGIKDLRIICEQKMSRAMINGNQKEILNFKNILEILKNDNCFRILDASISFNILRDLGFNTEESIKIYSDLLN